MHELIRANKFKSFGLLGILALILVLLGYFIGGAFGVGGHPGIAIAAVIWIVLCLISYFAGDSILLTMSRAGRIEKKDHPRLFNVVEEMTIASGMPMPKVYIIDDQALNAFATGRSPETASVAITSGLLAKLNRDELQGVIAHEMGHVKNRDILFMTIAGVTVGAVVLIADVYLRHMFWFGGGTRRHGRSRGGNQGGAQALLILIALVLAILAPILARLLYLACSRRREYLADASAAEMTRYPEGLASALEKISGSVRKVEGANRVTAPMYIVNPLAAKGSSGSVWSTHPPTGERINILRGMVHGASVRDYDNAWQAVSGSSAVPASAVAGAGRVEIREPAEDEKDPRERAREAVDIIRRLEGFALLTCACGLKLKIPPNSGRDKVICPNCKKIIALGAATTGNVM
jgi:heat shock protein HtpX